MDLTARLLRRTVPDPDDPGRRIPVPAWWSLRADFAGSAAPPFGLRSPFVDRADPDHDQIGAWWDLTAFARLPHLVRVRSLHTALSLAYEL